MKPVLILSAAATLFALAACSKSTPDAANTSADPMANTIVNSAPVEMPPAITAEKSFRCKDNSLAQVTFFQGAKQVSVRLPDATTPVMLRAPAAGEPYVAEGGWTVTGDETAITLASPDKPSQACHL